MDEAKHFKFRTEIIPSNGYATAKGACSEFIIAATTTIPHKGRGQVFEFLQDDTRFLDFEFLCFGGVEVCALTSACPSSSFCFSVIIVKIFVGNVALSTVNSVTDLGITYNNKLSFSAHIDNIVSKAALRANLVLSCFRSRNPDLLMRAFCAFVRPALEYCSVIWSRMFQNQIDKIKQVQRQFTKRLSGLH